MSPVSLALKVDSSPAEPSGNITNCKNYPMVYRNVFNHSTVLCGRCQCYSFLINEILQVRDGK